MSGDSPVDLETAITRRDRRELRLWLRLLTCSNLVEQTVRQRLRTRFDMTLPRFDLMAQLERAPDGLTMGELSRRLMVTGGNVTGMVDRLVDEKLVERRPAPHDRRSNIVGLTRAGRAQFDIVAREHLNWIRELMGEMRVAEIDELHRLLARLKRSVAAASCAEWTPEDR